ncbi:MAG: anti-sigma factor domain-containing protein, partial [Gemmatimonadota bacterium]
AGGGPGGLRRLAPLLAAAAGFAALALGALYFEVRSEGEALRADYEAALGRIEFLEASRAELDSLLAALVRGDVRTATLARQAPAPRVRLLWNPARRLLLVTASGLPPAPDGRTYQLWGIAPGRDPVSLGVFDTRPDGTRTTLVEAPELPDLEAGALSEEPAGGSPQPTSEPFLVGAWTAPSE